MSFMTGKGHKLTAFSIFMATTGSLLVSVLAALGSVFPDAVERLLWRKGRVRHHRKTSHWIVLYMAGFWLCYDVWGDATFPTLRALPAAFANRSWPALFSCLAFWFAGGGIHILCDACCGKVPLLNPFRKTFGWKFFEMSRARGEMSRGEIFFTAFVVLSCAATWLRRYVLI